MCPPSGRSCSPRAWTCVRSTASSFSRTRPQRRKVGSGHDLLAIGGHVALDPDRGGVLADVLQRMPCRQAVANRGCGGGI
jgi:hypothetical protein